MNSALRGSAVFISTFGGRGRSTHFERALFPAGTRSSSLELFFTHADPSGLPGETVPDIVTRGKEKTLPAMPALKARGLNNRGGLLSYSYAKELLFAEEVNKTWR